MGLVPRSRCCSHIGRAPRDPLPAISTIAASLVLGVVLSLSGVVKIIKAFRVTGWPGFLWELTAGLVKVICGVLIYLNPLKGAIAITVLIAIVFVLVGISQIGLALRVRPQQGWQWLVISGLIALLASAALTLKIPYTRFYTPGTIAGISILFAGLASVGVDRRIFSNRWKPAEDSP